MVLVKVNVLDSETKEPIDDAVVTLDGQMKTTKHGIATFPLDPVGKISEELDKITGLMKEEEDKAKKEKEKQYGVIASGLKKVDEFRKSNVMAMHKIPKEQKPVAEKFLGELKKSYMAMGDVYGIQAKAAERVYRAAKERVKREVEASKKLIEDYYKAAPVAMKESAKAARDSAMSIADKVVNYTERVWNEVWRYTKQGWSSIADYLKSGLNQVGRFFKKLFGG